MTNLTGLSVVKLGGTVFLDKSITCNIITLSRETC